MHVTKTNIKGNPNIGLYAFATDQFCLVGKEISEETIELLKEILKVPIFQINIVGTSLLGVFIAGNEKNLLIPEIAFESEIEKLKKISEEFNFNIHIIKTELTALGNNIACNENGCLINPDFPEHVKKEIEKAINLPTKEAKIAGIPTVGSIISMNKKGCAIHRDSEEFEIEFIKDLLKIKTETATVNMGNPFIKSGIIVNSNGFIVGEASGGPEITYLDEIFGFLDD